MQRRRPPPHRVRRTRGVPASLDRGTAPSGPVECRPRTLRMSPRLPDSAHGSRTIQPQGRAVDGRLDRLVPGDVGRRPRDDRRAERVPGPGNALGHRLHHAAAAGLFDRRFRGDAHQAPAAASRPQRRALYRAIRLALRADADPARRADLHRVHDADLDGAAGGHLPRREIDAAAGHGDRARPGRHRHHRAPRARHDRDRTSGRAARGARLRHFDGDGEVADPHRQCRADHLLDADHPVGRSGSPLPSMSGALRPPSCGRGSC